MDPHETFKEKINIIPRSLLRRILGIKLIDNTLRDFIYADKEVPLSWVQEKSKLRSLNIVERLKEQINNGKK